MDNELQLTLLIGIILDELDNLSVSMHQKTPNISSDRGYPHLLKGDLDGANNSWALLLDMRVYARIVPPVDSMLLHKIRNEFSGE